MVTKKYIPDRGDIVYLTFDPIEGHEQGGRRPAIVLSSREYNERIGLAIVCPITTKIKGYPFEIPVVVRGTASVILCDHIRSVAWNRRHATFVSRTDTLTLTDTVKKVALILTQ